MEQLNTAWKGACKATFGEEMGPMEEYERYLRSNIPPLSYAKSALSGKEVAFTGDYPKGVKVISNEEMGRFAEEFSKAPLNINEIKDIDSILDAIGGKIHYSGNVVLGNSREVLQSNHVADSQFVFRSHEVLQSKYVAYSHILNYSSYIFGSQSVGEDNFCINGYEIYRAPVTLECLRVYDSNHAYFCANMDNCADCMFSFNIRSKQKCIGNLELNAEKYAELSSKLLLEIRETLRSRKSLPSILDIIGGSNA